ncbi:group I intron-associated PD-(D/E)XK endonuclease [Halobacterium noricense]|uniref:group I intron-associated PD-(D/E)XK endonuclease n=1 Tax=Halobacterium noricense TaxID=223182 RepID=UPI001E2F8E63|nr:group I intron-associated PD-(D/E)XK endonuclease [Halobacterium noricense]UHH26605.1 group I intron-associated PD-(D/E)XK endonuclease [Halobacterium noricense]
MDMERGWRGDASEALVAADILRNGHGVAYPHGHEQKYDLIIDVEWGLLRVQVKTASEYDNYRYELEIDPERYPDGTVDIFAGAIHEEGTAIYVPAHEMGKTQRVNFNPPEEMPSDWHREEANLPGEFSLDEALLEIQEGGASQ